MWPKMATSCISALMSDPFSYYPLTDRINDGAVILSTDDNHLLVEDNKLRRLYVLVTGLDPFLNIQSAIRYEHYDLIISYDRSVAEYLVKERDDFISEMAEVYVYVYPDKEIIKNIDADIRCLDEKYFDQVFANYQYADADELHSGFAEHTIFGLFDKGELAGFIGMHADGTMGMLEVFKPYRKRGYGYQLEAFLINYLLDQNRLPYCNVEVTNTSSIALQQKLNMQKGGKVQYWIFKKDE